MKFCLIHHIYLTFHQPRPSRQLFAGKHFHSQQDAENAFQGFVKSWSVDFFATGINKLLISKTVIIVMVPILINTDVFMPSYNDLKFIIQNCNYFFTNLIARFCSLCGWLIFHRVCVLHVYISHFLSPFFVYWVVWVLSVVWISTLIRYILWKYLLPFTRLPFHFVDYFLHCTKVFGVMLSYLFILLFLPLLLVSNPPKILLRPMSGSLLPRFSSKSFMVSSLTFKSSIYFELIFVYGVR